MIEYTVVQEITYTLVDKDDVYKIHNVKSFQNRTPYDVEWSLSPLSDRLTNTQMGSIIRGETVQYFSAPQTIYVRGTQDNCKLQLKASADQVDAMPVTLASANSRYSTDAWGRPKTILDESLFSATWTFDIQARIWEEWAYTEGSGWSPQVGFTNSISEDHMLTVKSTTTVGGGCTLASKVHPKYQPNRGHLYSTALIHPNVTDVGLTRFGLGSPQDACAFEVEGDGVDWDIFAFRRFSGATSNRVSIKNKVLELFPNFDPTKGHVYDIQFQWRGVGNYYYFIDLQLVYAEEVLGTREELSMSDPALQAFFSTYCTEAGTERVAKFGCVDITSEGGNGHNKGFGAISSGDVLLPTGNAVSTPMMAVRVPRYIDYEGNATHINSRGVVMDMLNAWCGKDYQVKVWYFRDTTGLNLEALTWNAVPDSRLGSLVGGLGSDLDIAFLADKANGMPILSEFNNAGNKTSIKNEASNAAFNLTPGDIIVFCVKSASGTASATAYYSEEL